MKKIIGFMAFAFLMSILGTQEVSADQRIVGTALGYADKAKGYYNSATAYKASKDYNDISSSIAKKAIKDLCQKGCGRFTCGSSGAKKKVGEACKLICPPNDVKSCLEKM